MIYRNHEVMVPCPFHEDHDPSLAVVIVERNQVREGTYKCWGCGAHGNWNTLARKIGLQEYHDERNYADRELPKIETKVEYIYSHILDLHKLPRDYIWKRKPPIANETLRAFHAKYVTYNSRNYLYLPCEMDGEVYGHVLALQGRRGPDDRKYLNSRGPWPSIYWYGWDQAKTLSEEYVCIVEGPADAMQMHQHNIPAIAVLVNTWSDSKANWIAINFKKVVLCLDNDRSGKAMAKKIKTAIEKYVECKRIIFDAGTDPASLQEDGYKQLLRVIHKFIS
jgi:DNA primase